MYSKWATTLTAGLLLTLIIGTYDGTRSTIVSGWNNSRILRGRWRPSSATAMEKYRGTF